ncbi:hypothetical protein A2U01_0061240, partial [Trifolium medium]|nr:hypothetical protein [Trifolium medium]
IIDNRGWGKLINPPELINYEVVREFYANAIPVGEDPISFTTMVRGREIRFDREAINAYLQTPFQFQGNDRLCAFQKHLARGNWDIPLMTNTLLR